MKIYLVTTGEYSDKSNEAAFSTVPLAEAFIKKLARGGDIEGFELDVMKSAKDMLVHIVCLLPNGDVKFRNTSKRFGTRASIQSQWQDWEGNFVGESTVSSKHALKLASEHRQAILRGDER